MGTARAGSVHTSSVGPNCGAAVAASATTTLVLPCHAPYQRLLHKAVSVLCQAAPQNQTREYQAALSCSVITLVVSPVLTRRASWPQARLTAAVLPELATNNKVNISGTLPTRLDVVSVVAFDVVSDDVSMTTTPFHVIQTGAMLVHHGSKVHIRWRCVASKRVPEVPLVSVRLVEFETVPTMYVCAVTSVLVLLNCADSSWRLCGVDHAR